MRKTVSDFWRFTAADALKPERLPQLQDKGQFQKTRR